MNATGNKKKWILLNSRTELEIKRHFVSSFVNQTQNRDFIFLFQSFLSSFVCLFVCLFSLLDFLQEHRDLFSSFNTLFLSQRLERTTPFISSIFSRKVGIFFNKKGFPPPSTTTEIHFPTINTTSPSPSPPTTSKIN